MTSPQGASVLFFPEGTRSKDGKMASFKKVRLLQGPSAFQGIAVRRVVKLLVGVLWCSALINSMKSASPLHVVLQGAFSVAVKTGSPVVPITLIGTGKLMPNGQESRLYGGDGVKIIVHPRIQVQTLQGAYTWARPQYSTCRTSYLAS